MGLSRQHSIPLTCHKKGFSEPIASPLSAVAATDCAATADAREHIISESLIFRSESGSVSSGKKESSSEIGSRKELQDVQGLIRYVLITTNLVQQIAFVHDS